MDKLELETKLAETKFLKSAMAFSARRGNDFY